MLQESLYFSPPFLGNFEDLGNHYRSIINSFQNSRKLLDPLVALNRKQSDMTDQDQDNLDRGDGDGTRTDNFFTLKKWNAVAMWSWDVECDTCAICRVQVMDACLRCQAESKKDFYGKQDCVVVWGECNHSFHYCCMSLWVKQNNRCPLCQQEWSIQRMGK